MTEAVKVLNEAMDYFEKTETDPGGEWAFCEDYSSLGLDFRSPNGDAFWLDLERDGTILVMWKKADGEVNSVTFVQQPKGPT